jgi:enamine deaminase RidA (YjgF/YER057c/UK114 family)
MISERIRELGYTFEAAPAVVLDRFHTATRVGDLVFTSGQVPSLGDQHIRGRVGAEVDMGQARRAAELATVNCLRAVAAIADLDEIDRVAKVFGMVNCADGFDDTTGVINACSELLFAVLGERGREHARSAVGLTVPAGWAVEIDMVVVLK